MPRAAKVFFTTATTATLRSTGSTASVASLRVSSTNVTILRISISAPLLSH